MAEPGTDNAKPPKRLGRGLSEVSHVFLSAAERRKRDGLREEPSGCLPDRQEEKNRVLPGDGSSARGDAGGGFGFKEAASSRPDGEGAGERSAVEDADWESRLAADRDLWLPRATYISVTSGERVRGKTLLAGNLAYGFLARGRKVALVNADCDRPDILDVTASRLRDAVGDVMSAGDGFAGITALDALGAVAGSGEAPGHLPERAVGGAGLVRTLERAGREAQIVIVDTSPWADHSRAVWAISALSIVVAEPGSERLRSTYLAIKRVRSASPDCRIGLVLNCVRSYAEGEECYRKLAEVSRRFLKTNLRNYGYVLHDAVVSEAHGTATPLAKAFPDSKAARCIEAILGLIVMDESAIARRRREVTYQECALRKGRLQALKSSAF